MATKTGGDANSTDDPKDKTKDEPADSAPSKGGKAKAKAGDQGDDDPNVKQFTQADLDAALASDRQARRKSQTKSEPAPAKNKGKGDDDDDGERETLRKRAEGAEQKLRQQDARDDFEDEATRAGFKNPRKMYRLLKDDLTFDSSG